MRWEYLAIDFEQYTHAGGEGKLEPRIFTSSIDPATLGLEADQTIQGMLTVLDKVGRLGWELVSMVPIMEYDGSSTTRAIGSNYRMGRFVKAIFKRPTE